MATSLNRIRFRCDQCQAGLEARRSEIGGKIRCPYCHAAQTVPAASRSDVVDEGYAVTPADAPPAASAENYVSIVCGLCGTRLHGAREQIGQALTCPDCGTVSVLKPPPETETPPGEAPERVSAGEYDVRVGEGQPSPDDAVAHGRYIPVICKLCQTRLLATEDEVGRRIVCPDCRTENVVPAAPPEIVVDAATPGEYGVYGVSAAPKAESPPRYEDLFPFTCPRCRTRLHAHRREAGGQTTCPDCRTRFPIPPPPESIEPLRDETADVYGVRAADGGLPGVHAPGVHAPGAHAPDKPPQRPASPPRPRPPSSAPLSLPPRALGGAVGAGGAGVAGAVEQSDAAPSEGARTPVAALSPSAKAREIRQKRRRERLAAAPKHPFLQGVWLFPISGSVWTFWVATSGWIFLTLTLLAEAVPLAFGGDPRIAFVGMMFLAGVCFLSFLGLVAVAGYWLAILHDTGEGCETIDNWPELVVVDWGIGFLHLIVASACAVGIGTILHRFAEPLGVPLGAALALSVHVLFPLLLLSSLETNIPFFPVSPPILRSLGNSLFAWIAFYLAAGLVLAAAATTSAVCSRWPNPWVLGSGSCVLAALAIIYFRLLGRLTLCCVNRARKADAEADDAEELDEQRAG